MKENVLAAYFIVWFISQDQEQSTPLHAAAYLGDVHTMDLLITSGRKMIYLSLKYIRLNRKPIFLVIDRESVKYRKIWN